MSVEPIPPKDNYVAYPKNAASVADASTKIKVGGAIFGLILATAGIGGGIYCGIEGCRANATTTKGNSSQATTTTLTPTTTQATSTTTAGIKYLIAGGSGEGYSDKLTEVVEYVETTSPPSFGQLPSPIYYAVGAMLGNTPILCGGRNYMGNHLDTCISYQDSEWSQSHSMVQKRRGAAGVKINSTTFWILGGFNSYDGYLDSTEFIIQGQTNGVPGPKLPYFLYEMCAVKLSENEIFVIGGYSGGYRNEVWIYDPQNGFARTQGPSLTTARSHHSCSTMRDGEKTVIIAAGGVNNGQFLDSVEIYDPIDNTWYSGPSLPNSLDSSAMAKSPDGRGVILFGGSRDGNGHEKRILELRAGDNSWKILDKTLEKGRHDHVVIELQ